MSTVAHVDHMELSERIEERLSRGELTPEQVDEFRDFLDEVDRDVFRHRVVTSNPYTRWFSRGEVTDDELRHFLRQFSVFSNQFLVAALERVINAPSLAQGRAAKEILLNELGVIYRKPGPAASGSNTDDKDREGDPELVSTEGSVDGGTFRFRAAHFEWLLAVGQGVGLGYDDLGKRKNGRPSTLKFCDALRRLFGHEDGQVASGASFAVENWAAAGFWQELEDGLTHIKQSRLPALRLAFFTWHNRVEAQHASHVMEEVEEAYFDPEFSRDRFFQGARAALEAIALFWDGLEDDHLAGVTR
jgi:pyrroloquinoline quinone (PQQ) biosynthesis protein C